MGITAAGRLALINMVLYLSHKSALIMARCGIIFTINGTYPRTGITNMPLVSGQLTYVLYPLWSLISTIFNSRPSEELTFHLSYCYFAASAASDMCGIWRIYIGVWQIYTAGIDLGQLMHVLYPLRNLFCAMINSKPSEELTFHLSHCYFAAGAAWGMCVWHGVSTSVCGQCVQLGSI